MSPLSPLDRVFVWAFMSILFITLTVLLAVVFLMFSQFAVTVWNAPPVVSIGIGCWLGLILFGGLWIAYRAER